MKLHAGAICFILVLLLAVLSGCGGNELALIRPDSMLQPEPVVVPPPPLPPSVTPPSVTTTTAATAAATATATAATTAAATTS